MSWRQFKNTGMKTARAVFIGKIQNTAMSTVITIIIGWGYTLPAGTHRELQPDS
jgi:hypothetical protein